MQLHMLGDGTLRGATLEACITKIKLSAGIYGIMYVYMDAPNLLLHGFPLYRHTTDRDECYTQQHRRTCYLLKS